MHLCACCLSKSSWLDTCSVHTPGLEMGWKFNPDAVQVVGLVEELMAGGKVMAYKDVHAKVAEGIEALQRHPVLNVEMWAKLARAALSRASYGQALECSRAALRGVPQGVNAAHVRQAEDAPELKGATWFWLAVAELVQARATLALLRPALQDVGVQLALQRTASVVPHCHSSFGGETNTVSPLNIIGSTYSYTHKKSQDGSINKRLQQFCSGKLRKVLESR